MLEQPLPTVTLENLEKSSAVQLPLAAIAFVPMCSVKPDADHGLTFSMAKLILKHGFVSATEPLLCTQHAELLTGVTGLMPPWSSLGPLKPFSVGYVKGKARARTLLTILAICVDNGIKVQDVP